MTTIGPATLDADRAAPPLDEVHTARYETIADPPFDAGAANESVACRAPTPDTTTPVGALGGPTTLMARDGADGMLVPAGFDDVTTHE